MPSNSPVRYRIDFNDCLTDVNEGWSIFAAENGGGMLEPARVLGRPLWDFFADPTTIALYRGMVKRVRDGGLPVRFQFRCDAPSTRRGLAMEITADGEGGVVFQVTSVWEQGRAAMLLLDSDHPRADTLLTICGWCKRVRLGDDSWVEIEAAVTVLGLFGGAPLPQLTHGMCPSCSTILLGALEDSDAGAVVVGDVRST
ncbi:MAG: hypothetical protein V4558_09760 [Gemmatimonadota bacterium]